jgi:hypothetical protein
MTKKEQCTIREYTAFLSKTKVDIWVIMENESQVAQSDELFSLCK